MIRSKTDEFDVKRKRPDSDGTSTRSRKHPRRTLSEQIYIPKVMGSEGSLLSPRSPAPERVNKALSDRIQHLKDENATLQLRIERETQGQQFAADQLIRIEAQMQDLMKRVDQAEGAVATAKEDATAAKNEAASTRAELAKIRKDWAKKMKYSSGSS